MYTNCVFLAVIINKPINAYLLHSQKLQCYVIHVILPTSQRNIRPFCFYSGVLLYFRFKTLLRYILSNISVFAFLWSIYLQKFIWVKENNMMMHTF